MNKKIPYLTQSSDRNVYGYRRRIPEEYRHLFGGKREIKKSFKTKSFILACNEVEKVNEWYDNQIATAGLKAIPSSVTERHRQQLITQDLKMKGLLDETLLKLKPQDAITDPDVSAYFRFVGLESERRQVFHDMVDAGYDDWTSELHKSLQIKFADLSKEIEAIPDNKYIRRYQEQNEHIGLAYKELFETQYVQNPDDGSITELPLEQQQALAAKRKDTEFRIDVMRGQAVTTSATWADAVTDYIDRVSKTGNKGQIIKKAVDTRSACEAISRAFVNGMDTQLTDIVRANVEDVLVALWPHAGTRQRNARIFQAVINKWNQRHPDQAVANMFMGLVDGAEVEQDTQDRRSFSREEYSEVWQRVWMEDNPELQFVALLGLYAGVPQGEAAGIERADCRGGDVPYILIQSNSSRHIGKGRYPRAIPLVGRMGDHLRTYVRARTFENDARLFPSFFRPDGRIRSDKLSKALNKFAVNKVAWDNRRVSWYSTRHTFADICEAAGVSDSHSRYLMGHADPVGGSHRKYGTNPPTNDLIASMEAVSGWEKLTWGDFDRYEL